jgi:organizing structure protein 2
MLYVGVAALTGSVLARGRFMRTVLPPTFFLIAFDHFLPKTSHNLREYLGEVETHYFPSVAEKHATARAHTAMTFERIRFAWHDGLESAEVGVGKVVKAIEETTGLKVAEALGTGRSVAKRAEVEVQHLVRDLAHKPEEVGHKAEEVKDTVVEEIERRV